MKRNKRILYIIIIFLCILLCIGVGLYSLNSKDEKFIQQLIVSEKDKVSMVVIENNKLIGEMNSESFFPLASVYKLMILIELVNQVENNKIDLQEKIDIEEIEKFNFLKKDVNYNLWKNDVVSDNEKISIYEVALGVSQYSSNPNSDYLMNKLGIKNINHTSNNLVKKHTKLYPITASLLITDYYKRIKKYDSSQIENKKNSINQEEYEDLSFEINEMIKNNTYPKNNDLIVSEKDQYFWSSHMPSSTARDYAEILNNLDGIFKKNSSSILFKKLIEYEDSKEGYTGGKTGDTIDTTNRIILKENKENKMVVVIFTKNLNYYEHIKVENNIDDFIDRILSKELIIN